MGSPLLVKIVPSADEDYCIAIRGKDSIVLVLRDPRDPRQNWIKDERCKTEKDGENQSAFALINQATGEAMMPDYTSLYNNLLAKRCNHPEEPTLWASRNVQPEGSMSIYLMKDPSLMFIVKNHIHEGSVVQLKLKEDAKSHQWKIVPHEVPLQLRPTPNTNLSVQPTVTISCRQKENYNLTICNDSVIVAPSNLEDKKQHWIKDMTYARHAKDVENRRAFALVNKATGQAIKHSFRSHSLVRLVQFNPYHFDESILWTERNRDDGYSYIRMIQDPSLVFDLMGANYNNGWVLLGIWIYDRSHVENHMQQWKFEELQVDQSL